MIANVKSMDNYLICYRIGKVMYVGRYSDGKKITIALTEEDFVAGMEKGTFLKWRHKAALAALHYLALRRSEIPQLKKEDGSKTKELFYIDVKIRLKGSKQTIAIPLSLEAPYVGLIVKAFDYTRKGEAVFPYSSKTIYNIVHRVFKYPHLHRLSRITWLIGNFGTLTARSWTGLSLQTLEWYAEIVNLEKAGRSLAEMGAIRK